jgi:hypothetical protein
MCSALDPTNKNSYTRGVLRAMDPTRNKASGAGALMQGLGLLVGGFDPGTAALLGSTGALIHTGGAIYQGSSDLSSKESVADDNLKRQVMAESQPPPTLFDAISADARMMKRRYAKSLGFSPYFLRQ